MTVARVSNLAAEVLKGGAAGARVTTLAVEVLKGGNSVVQVSTVAIEVLRDPPQPEAHLDQCAVEVVQRSGSGVHVEQSVVEVAQGIPHATHDQCVVEVVVKDRAAKGLIDVGLTGRADLALGKIMRSEAHLELLGRADLQCGTSLRANGSVHGALVGTLLPVVSLVGAISANVTGHADLSTGTGLRAHGRLDVSMRGQFTTSGVGVGSPSGAFFLLF